MSGDPYKRRLVDENTHQCGCYWVRDSRFGDVLVECEFHRQVSEARYRRERREHVKKLVEQWRKRMCKIPEW